MKYPLGVLISPVLHFAGPGAVGFSLLAVCGLAPTPPWRRLQTHAPWQAYLEAESPRLYCAVGVLGSFRCNAALRGGLASLGRVPAATPTYDTFRRKGKRSLPRARTDNANATPR
jgi:hypothetical protein